MRFSIISDCFSTASRLFSTLVPTDFGLFWCTGGRPFLKNEKGKPANHVLPVAICIELMYSAFKLMNIALSLMKFAFKMMIFIQTGRAWAATRHAPRGGIRFTTRE